MVERARRTTKRVNKEAEKAVFATVMTKAECMSLTNPLMIASGSVTLICILYSLGQYRPFAQPKAGSKKRVSTPSIEKITLSPRLE